MSAEMITHAMILAAGRGERMRPLTDTTPKPMLSVQGKPLIAWHLEAMAAAGIHHVVINLAYLGDQIKSFVGSGDRFGLSVRFSQEPPGALETAGGIAQAQPWLSHGPLRQPQPFLVVNADIWTDWPLAQAHQIRKTFFDRPASTCRCHLVMVDNPAHHPEGDFSLRGETIGPKNPSGNLTFSGIGVYDPRMFSTITPGHRAALAPLLNQMIAQGYCTGSYHRGLWSDVGSPERLLELNQVPGDDALRSETRGKQAG